MSIQIIKASRESELFFEMDNGAAPTYLEVDLPGREVSVGYHAGSGTPGRVWHGYTRRYDIPLLTADAANRLMERIAPLAERMCVDWSEEIGRSGRAEAVLGADGRAAEAELIAALPDENTVDPEDVIDVWDAANLFVGNEAEEYGITADTSDAELERIATQMLDEVRSSSASGVVVAPGLTDYLRDLRDELVEQD
ncbi:hypothetical protein [Saccharomonospora glauca]|uniref:Uncharacterized protein n=1 Tax=Saccharomonospora glauca K62 TaxID=928724 RepID=I1D8E4_9PSEU|nr:hypothetical protein [Saccharomonospora glauca]EIF01219.1 hypothetical protein SacglDRAFT_00004 [Saccharomonospora glauca K62]